MKKFDEKIIKIFFAVIIFFFVFFAFYDLSWGAPFFFHPDERNIASSITQLKFPDNLNPHFFAYGALPIYIVYLLGIVTNSITNHTLTLTVSFEQAIVLGRFISALLSILTVFLIYKTTRLFFGKKEALLASAFSLTSVAYLQFSHFSTFEIWLSFFSLLMVLFFALFLNLKKIKYFILASCIFGILCALKASSVALILIPTYVIFYNCLEQKKILPRIKHTLMLVLIFVYFSFALYFISAPFNLADTNGFLSAFNYERNVATGTLSVFYTGSFLKTLPIIFQYKNVLPFLVNPVITIISLFAIPYLIILFFKKRNIFLGLILIMFLSIFISNSFLFVKWTRYLVPSVSFLYILISIFLFDIGKRMNKNLFKLFLFTIIFINCFFAFAYIKTVRLSKDTRVEAVSFAKKNIPASAQVTSEIYDLGITPFNPVLSKISLFNFYDLEVSQDLQKDLPSILKNSKYIILPSQRIYKSRTTNPSSFPKGHEVYKNLFSGKSGFIKVYETSCDIFCKITYLGDPVFNVEETANVFDRPVVFIFKKK